MITLTALKKKYNIHVTTNHNDKMEGLSSMSTSPLLSETCRKRAEVKDSICAHCYSITMNHRFTNLQKCLIKNFEVLTTTIIPEEDLPFLFSETGMFRFEAFGDLNSEIQVVNYFNMAKVNPHMKCALWTKNPWFIERAIKNYGIEKPENLKIIGSSYFLNKPMTDFYKKYDFIDNVFTVYTPDFVKENNIFIGCGGRSCASCKHCYNGTHDNYEINELLK